MKKKHQFEAELEKSCFSSYERLKTEKKILRTYYITIIYIKYLIVEINIYKILYAYIFKYIINIGLFLNGGYMNFFLHRNTKVVFLTF